MGTRRYPHLHHRQLLIRGIIGSFHQVSVKHLHRYLSEFQFRWNNRKAQDIFILVIAALVIGAALPYKNLIASIDEEPKRVARSGAGRRAFLGDADRYVSKFS
jgi:hypothetical protein